MLKFASKDIKMKQINTALCSFGMSGLVFHAPFIEEHPGFNLYGVWERSKKTAAEKYPDVISFDLLEEMLADKNVELVIVNTPNYTHFDLAKKALLAGKHVLVEKAFTVTVSEAQELVELAKIQNKKLAVFQNRRYDSDFKTVKKIFDEGILGDIKEAEFHYDRYNLALSPKAHKETTNAGAGILHDLGPHLIDQALCLFGMPESLFGFLKITRPGSLVNDYFDMTLFYPSFSVRLKAGFIVKEPQPSYILHGTKGSFLKSRGDVQEDTLKTGAKPESNDWGTEPASAQGLLNVLDNEQQTIREFVVTEQGDYLEFYDALYNAIVANAKLPVSGEDGVRVMKIIEAVLESNTSKKVVELP